MPTLPCRYISAKNAAEARAIGAAIAEDAILARLSEPLFAKVQRGELARDQALAIAKWLPNHKLQEQFAGYLAKQAERGNGLPASEVEAMTKRHADAQRRRAEQDDVASQ